MRLEAEKHPLWKHCQLEHDGRKVEFSMKVCGRFQSCMVRQVNKPVRMLRSKAHCLMNSNSKFQQAPLVRWVTLSGLQEEQGKGEGDTLWSRRAEEQQGRRGRNSRTGRGRPEADGRSRGRGTGRWGIRAQGQWLQILVFSYLTSVVGLTPNREVKNCCPANEHTIHL